MISFEPRVKSRLAGGVLAVAAAVFAHAGSSQPLPEPTDDVLLELAEQIEREQQNGPLSESLVAPLTTLSLVYQESGNHTLAIAALQRALHVVRANRGLHSFDQASLLRLSIRNEEARGNAAGAWKLEQQLLELTRRYPDELRAIPIFREVGDRRIALLDRYLEGETPSEIVLGCYYQLLDFDDEGSCTSGGKHVVIQGILLDAWSSYQEAISVYLRNEMYGSLALRELEMDLLRSAYLYGNYGLGAASLERLWGYVVANSEPELTQIEALVRLADWELLFGHIVAAHRQYLHVHELLDRQAEGAPASSARAFLPEQPIVLPTFVQNPFATDPDGSVGAIDVAFDVTWHGNAKRVEILDATPDVPDDAKEQLIDLISRSRFRPRIVGGEIPQSSRVALRYHVGPQTGVLEDPSDEVRRRNIRRYRAALGLTRHFTEDLRPARSSAAGTE